MTYKRHATYHSGSFFSSLQEKLGKYLTESYLIPPNMFQQTVTEQKASSPPRSPLAIYCSPLSCLLSVLHLVWHHTKCFQLLIWIVSGENTSLVLLSVPFYTCREVLRSVSIFHEVFKKLMRLLFLCTEMTFSFSAFRSVLRCCNDYSLLAL